MSWIETSSLTEAAATDHLQGVFSGPGGREAFVAPTCDEDVPGFMLTSFDLMPGPPAVAGSMRSDSREACRERGRIEEWALQLRLSRRALFASRVCLLCATSELFLRRTGASNATVAISIDPAAKALLKYSRPTGCSRSGNDREQTPSSIPHP